MDFNRSIQTDQVGDMVAAAMTETVVDEGAGRQRKVGVHVQVQPDLRRAKSTGELFSVAGGPVCTVSIAYLDDAGQLIRGGVRTHPTIKGLLSGLSIRNGARKWDGGAGPFASGGYGGIGYDALIGCMGATDLQSLVRKLAALFHEHRPYGRATETWENDDARKMTYDARRAELRARQATGMAAASTPTEPPAPQPPVRPSIPTSAPQSVGVSRTGFDAQKAAEVVLALVRAGATPAEIRAAVEAL